MLKVPLTMDKRIFIDIVIQFTMTQNLKISVIIMAYNRQNYIKQAITSCVEQTLGSEMYEVIVLKNFDYTPEIENERGVSIRFIKYKDEKIGNMIIEGVDNARYDIISFLDDDDVFMPNKLELVLKNFRENQGLIFLRNNMKIFVNHLNVESISKKNSMPFILDNLNRKSIFQAINREGYLNSSTISILKKVILKKRSLIKDQETAPDITFFYISLSEPSAKLMFIDDQLTFYRFHDSASHLPELQHNIHLQKVKEITIRTINCLKRIQKSVNDITLKEILSLTISSWRIQLSLLTGERVDFSTFIESIKFSVYRRKLVILFTTFLAALNNHFTNGCFSKLFYIVDGYRARKKKLL